MKTTLRRAIGMASLIIIIGALNLTIAYKAIMHKIRKVKIYKQKKRTIFGLASQNAKEE